MSLGDRDEDRQQRLWHCHNALARIMLYSRSSNLTNASVSAFFDQSGGCNQVKLMPFVNTLGFDIN